MLKQLSQWQIILFNYAIQQPFPPLQTTSNKDSLNGKGGWGRWQQAVGLAAKRLPPYKFHANTSRAGSSCTFRVSSHGNGDGEDGWSSYSETWRGGGEEGEVVSCRLIVREKLRAGISSGDINVRTVSPWLLMERRTTLCAAIHIFLGGSHQLQTLMRKSHLSVCWKTATTVSVKMSIWINRGTN